MGGLLHAVQPHGSNKPAPILHFKKTKIQILLYSPIGFYKHGPSLYVKFIRKKFILLSLSLHACGQPLLLQFLIFTWVEGLASWFTPFWVVFPSEIKKGLNKSESWGIGLQSIKPPTWGNVCSQSGINSPLVCPLHLSKPEEHMIQEVQGWSAVPVVRKQPSSEWESILPVEQHCHCPSAAAQGPGSASAPNHKSHQTCTYRLSVPF